MVHIQQGPLGKGTQVIKDERKHLKGHSGVCVNVRMHICKGTCMCISVCLCFFQQVWLVWVLWRGGEVKVETNSSLGDEGSHNYVQFSS